MASFDFSNCNENEVEAIARDFADVAKIGDVITLSGDLGSGKTHFCRAFIRHFLSVPDLEVPSPTYLISIEHKIDGKPPVNHMDLYRISDASEMDELGVDEILENGILLIEWPEKAIRTLPSDRLDTSLEIVDAEIRNLTLKANDDLASRFHRSVQIGSFLRNHHLNEYTRKPFAADASARNYELIQTGETTSILMDAPSTPDGPPVKNGLPYSKIAHLAEEVDSFVAIAKLLRSKGFNTPEIFAEDCEKGLVLLEHLGTGTIINDDRTPIDNRYVEAAGMLASLHTTNWSGTGHINGSTINIPSYDQTTMMIEVELLTDWYLNDGQQSATTDDINGFNEIWSRYSAMAQEFRQSIVLRDFHSPNIIWQENRTGMDRIGLIDFQDALIGPAVYDLVSLAQDARIAISTELESRIIHQYLCSSETNLSKNDEEQFHLEYAIMGAQRASKILGIFVRLHLRDGKPEYRKLIPAVRTYLKKNLQHPALSEYRNWCERVINL